MTVPLRVTPNAPVVPGVDLAGLRGRGTTIAARRAPTASPRPVPANGVLPFAQGFVAVLAALRPAPGRLGSPLQVSADALMGAQQALERAELERLMDDPALPSRPGRPRL